MKKMKTKKFALSILMLCLVATTSAKEAVNYKDYVAGGENSKLISLATDLNPSIYLNDGVLKQYGNEAATVLFTDVASITMLYEENGDFSEVELIWIFIKSDAEEATKLNLEGLTSFESLKYVLFVYQYDECGDKKDDTCLKAKTEEKITANGESEVQILYLLSIPQ